ncbi:MAG: TlpA disulfide reductase family protein [bacterium]|nr:TlpA disulfide reductase family protein [bacterium]MDE0290198.1 TlpA disulfide reductase family protein [bacterium]MDE0437079.1 TlpA disulfide reductase family protein [bacterium]
MARTPEGSNPGESEASPRTRTVTVTLSAVAALTAVIVAGLLVLFLVDGESPPAEPAPEAVEPVIDVAGFPRGALAGQPAPEFSLSLFDGSDFVLSAHLSGDGRPLVLNLWASWCTPCRREIPEFSEVAVANPEVAFVGAAVEDARGPAEAFATEVAAAYPLGIDDRLTVKNGYPFVGLPVTYLIDANGTVSRQIQGQLSGTALQAFIDHDFSGG